MKEKFLENLKEALTTYSYSTKVPLVLLDENGETVYSIGNQEPFCKFFKEFTGDMNPCSQTHLYAAKQSEELGEAYTFFCPAGLIHYTVPVIKKGVFRGSVLAGPILMDFSDQLMISEIMQKFNIDLKYLGMVESKIRSIQVIDPTRVRHLGNLLFIVVYSLLDDEKKELENRKLIASHQSDLNEKIQTIKDEKNVEFYSYETEKELLLKVRNGDVIGAKNILNDMIGRILFASGGNINVIKSKTLELCTLLSRASIDGGADSNTIIDLNSKFLYKISNIKNIEDLSYWVIHMLDSFTQNVFNFNDSKNPVL
ncbi:MAG: PocR ligand-binding domain-containing protein, partial [Intestinibacter bartlettii]|uniref:PocR ligand-binding domain-containing protein n=1 Tax=Intestinibacter bartlettii TaxID=261299 RepID=UPI0026EDA5AE